MVQLRCDMREQSPICLETTLGRAVTFLRCGHFYHTRCLHRQRSTTSLSMRLRCALCRSPYASDTDSPDSDSSDDFSYEGTVYVRVD